VAPLNLGIRLPQELEGAVAPVWQELLRYFQARDRQVIVTSVVDPELLWLQALEKVEHSEALPRELATVSGVLARQLHQDDGYDLLLMPALLFRNARVHGRYAVWDGVRRLLPARGWAVGNSILMMAGGNSIVERGFSGRLPAVSLYVMVLTSEGTVAYQGVAGLDVVHELHRTGPPWNQQWTLRPQSQPLLKREHLREGIELAFELGLPRGNWAW
jgi:hypothetical protein